jgi:hypothetical protein
MLPSLNNLKRKLKMTAVFLPNWLWIVIAIQYILIAVIFIIKFIVDMFYLRRALKIDKACNHDYPLFK